MNKKRFAVLAALLFGGAALAVTGSIAVNYGSQWIQGTLFVGSTATTANGVTRMLGQTCDCDFPSIPTQYSWTCDNPCAVTNAKLGDPCEVGAIKASPDDGGSAFNVNSDPRCVVVSNGVVRVSVHNLLGDAGALDLPDAGYMVRVISSQ